MYLPSVTTQNIFPGVASTPKVLCKLIKAPHENMTDQRENGDQQQKLEDTASDLLPLLTLLLLLIYRRNKPKTNPGLLLTWASR